MPGKQKLSNSKQLNKPNSIVAGFPRCGSTYLYNLLKQHPEISTSPKKEINYFMEKRRSLLHPETSSLSSMKSFREYCSLFKNKPIRIDCSIGTAYSNGSVDKIKKYLGNIGIIFLTRKNKEKLKKSIYHMMKTNGDIKKNLSYKDFINKEFKKIRYVTKHGKFIKEFEKKFKRIIVANLIEEKTNKEVEKILKFLGVKKIKFNKKINRATSKDILRKQRKLAYLKRRIEIARVKLKKIHNNL
jgi:hypothetical protein